MTQPGPDQSGSVQPGPDQSGSVQPNPVQPNPGQPNPGQPNPGQPNPGQPGPAGALADFAPRTPGAGPASCSVDILAVLEFPVPPALAHRAEAWRAGSPAVPPRRSASVLLLRDGPSGLQTYLLHRHARMLFAASMTVFPGGAQEPADSAAPDPVRACAVRETFEETGVALNPADLRDWAEWTTPEVEPRRYATRFFVAELPDGQQAQDLSGETDRAEWTTPVDALAAAEAGRIELMPPTRTMLMELAALDSVAAALRLAEGRLVVPVLPQLVRNQTGWVFRYPAPGPDPGNAQQVRVTVINPRRPGGRA